MRFFAKASEKVKVGIFVLLFLSVIGFGAAMFRVSADASMSPEPAGDSIAALSDEALKSGSANARAPLAADAGLGLVYVPTGSASPDFYGGERKGDNLYANSLVALHADTGKVAWYRQLVSGEMLWQGRLPAGGQTTA